MLADREKGEKDEKRKGEKKREREREVLEFRTQLPSTGAATLQKGRAEV
jgi:hypothetical protein